MQKKGTIRLARLMDGAQLAELERGLESSLGYRVELEQEIDDAVIGGFIITLEDHVYDYSYMRMLNEMGQFIKNEHAPLSTFQPDDSHVSVGVVERAADGVLRIRGLQKCRYGELIEVGDASAIAMNILSEDTVDAVMLSEDVHVEQGTLVRSTNDVVKVPVGQQLLGRIVDPIGRPLDGKPDPGCTTRRPIETESPPIHNRQNVNTPLMTGILSIDSMIPVGRGQRELIIGDRQTGKTTIAIDTILNQKKTGVYCVYVSIGQKASTVADVVQTFQEYGAMDYTTVVVSTASDPAPMQYIAPYAGCAIAEELMYEGKDVLIVYDDLSKHAVAYRAMSLLLRRPPGREAYPGDVFYLHSRLLERAARLSDECGGGSMTALPIIETMAGDISAYIPTNVISITDGQIYLEAELFNEGMRPAVNVGLSVSRVGGSAQTKAMHKVAGRMRLDLAQYRELSVFSQFAGELEASTKEALDHGLRITSCLKQPQHTPLAASEQVVVLYTVLHKLSDCVPVENLQLFSRQFVAHMRLNASDVLNDIEVSKDLSDESAARIEQEVGKFLPKFFANNKVEAIVREPELKISTVPRTNANGG